MPAAAGATKTSTFFGHCFGRQALISPSTTDGRGSRDIEVAWIVDSVTSALPGPQRSSPHGVYAHQSATVPTGAGRESLPMAPHLLPR